MVVVTAKEMQLLDQRAITELGIPSLVLMENAGVAVVNAMEQEFGDLSGKRCLILVGKGNNGGDGLVVARHLLNRNAKVKVYLVAEEGELSDDCRYNLNIFRKLQGEIHQITKASLPKLKISLSLTDLVVDAILGTGFTGELKGLLVEIIRLVNNCRKPVVAVDVPSGVDGTTGTAGSSAIRADLTVTLGFCKTGLLLYPGRDYCGKIKVVDIGIPKSLVVSIKRYTTEANICELLPPRPRWAHKGTFGHCLVIAGSKSMTGAAYLTAHAMLRAGAGVVTLAVPESIRQYFPPSEVIVRPIPETGTGSFGLSSVEALLALMTDKSVVVIGPGLGQDPELELVIKELLQHWQGPLVVDADGLNNIRDLSWLVQIPAAVRRDWVFTPHPGEMARLLNTTAEQINRKRLETAWEAYQQIGVNVVLKGAPTIIAGDNQVYINSTGNPGMSTAGMGDVLTGIIGGLMSQGMNSFLAAVAGVYIHGRAGDCLQMQYGLRGIVASDMLSVIPRVMHNEEG